MSSKASCSERCGVVFHELKLAKTHKYIIFTLSDDLKEIVVKKTSESNNYADFVADLPKTECRWAVYDFDFEDDNANIHHRITFISWYPDYAKINQKMMFMYSMPILRNTLVGVVLEIKGTDHDDVSFESILEEANRVS